MEEERIDIKLVFKHFRSLKFCSGASEDEGDYEHIELEKIFDHVLKCVSAVAEVLSQSDHFKDKKKIVQSYFKVFRSLIDGIESSCIQLSDPNPTPTPPLNMLIHNQFRKKSFKNKISLLHWQVALLDCDMESGIRDCSIEDSKNVLTPGHVIAMVKYPDMDVVKYLFDKNHEWAKIKDEHDNLAMHYAARHSDSVELIQYLLPMS